MHLFRQAALHNLSRLFIKWLRFIFQEMWHHREAAKMSEKGTGAELNLWKAGWIIRKDLEEVNLLLGGSLQREKHFSHLQENINLLCYEQMGIL